LVESAQHTRWPKLRQRAGAVPTKNRSGTVFPSPSLSSAYAVPCAVPYGVPLLVPAGVEEIA
jgi:hypothetical protein